MRKAMVGSLSWIPGIGASDGGRLGGRRRGAEPRSSTAYQVKATLVGIDLATKQITYVDAGSGQLRAAKLSEQALPQAVKLTSGQRVTLHCRGASESDQPIVDSIKKRGSHKKLWILGLSLAFVIGSIVAVANAEPI